MADNDGAAEPGNNNNGSGSDDQPAGAAEGTTTIKVTVKTPKDKEEIAVSEDASVTQVGAFERES